MDTFFIFDVKAKLFLLNSILITGLVTVCARYTKNSDIVSSTKDVFFTTSFFSALFVIGDVILRICHSFGLLIDGNSQSNVDDSISPENIFGYSTTLTTILIIMNAILFITIFVVYMCEWPFSHIGKFTLFICIPCVLMSWILPRLVELANRNLLAGVSLSSMKGLDYGTGLAYSYYYGYLRIVLPSTGTASKGLLEKIENIEDAHNITFASHKLIILIPSSSYIPPDLKEASYQWMESAIDLEEEQRDRAGVKRRSYQNNVYKIYPDGEKSVSSPKYVVAEGATPLLTFHEVMKHSHMETNVYKKYRNEIVKTFYEKLNELINNDPECKEICEIIYYNDYDSKGVKINVAKVILDRLDSLSNADA